MHDKDVDRVMKWGEKQKAEGKDPRYTSDAIKLEEFAYMQNHIRDIF